MVAKKPHIHLIGIDASGLTSEKTRILTSCADIFCSDRFIEVLRPVLANSPNIRVCQISPVSKALAQIKERSFSADVAVLVGGDPLFFGIGRLLVQTFAGESIRIYPAISSMQEAFARFKIPWDDAVLLSVHGRDLDDIIQRIQDRNKIFFLTDSTNTPSRLASFLLQTIGEENTDCFEIHVAENLGREDEHLTSGNLKEISKGKFSDLSVVIILRSENRRAIRFGLQEDEIAHSRGLITKNEVRAATLHALRLPETGILWDIGAGSGSVSIEAAAISPGLTVFAVESKSEQLENIRKNRVFYSAYTIRPVLGFAPEILYDLPDPDRIFVGGSGGNLEKILKYSAERLHPGGIIVVNGVLENTCRQSPEILYRLGFEVFISTVQVTRTTFPEKNSTEFNPISIITGCKTR